MANPHTLQAKNERRGEIRIAVCPDCWAATPTEIRAETHVNTRYTLLKCRDGAKRCPKHAVGKR